MALAHPISASAVAVQADSEVTVQRREFGIFKRDRRAFSVRAKVSRVH